VHITTAVGRNRVDLVGDYSQISEDSPRTLVYWQENPNAPPSPKKQPKWWSTDWAGAATLAEILFAERRVTPLAFPHLLAPPWNSLVRISLRNQNSQLIMLGQLQCCAPHALRL
jgi:hypothetical protein